MTIQEQYENLVKTIRGYNPAADFQHIQAAYEFAREAHKDQKRKSGEPYIIHPLAVAQIVAEELRLDSESIDKLDTLLLFGESALYLTVVLIQNVRKATSLSIKEWHAKHVSMRDGLWFGTGFDSQYAFDISKRIRHGLGNDFSYVITAGTASAYKPISTL